MLATVPSEAAEAAVQELHELGYGQAAVIGRAVESSNGEYVAELESGQIGAMHHRSSFAAVRVLVHPQRFTLNSAAMPCALQVLQQ